MGEFPRRLPALEINPVADDGFMIYRPEQGRVHYLNHTAVFILELCNGENSPARISGLVQAAYGLPTPPEQEVCEMLAKLAEEGLVE